MQLTTEEIKNKLLDFNSSVLSLVQSFQDETGFIISDIDINYIENATRCGNYTIPVKVETKIRANL